MNDDCTAAVYLLGSISSIVVVLVRVGRPTHAPRFRPSVGRLSAFDAT